MWKIFYYTHIFHLYIILFLCIKLLYFFWFFRFSVSYCNSFIYTKWIFILFFCKNLFYNICKFSYLILNMIIYLFFGYLNLTFVYLFYVSTVTFIDVIFYFWMSHVFFICTYGFWNRLYIYIIKICCRV